MTTPGSPRHEQRYWIVDRYCLANGTLRAGIAWPLMMAALAILLCMPAGIFFGRQGVEKLLTALAMPVGFAWWLLTAWMLLSWFRAARGSRWKATAVWLAVTVLTTAPLPTFCMQRLESRIAPFHPNPQSPLDVVVVLGGGTRTGPSRAEVAESGDRVVYAAELFLQGQCRHLITTGTAANTVLGTADHPFEQTKQIWMDLGIPETAISTLPGQNTYEEIRNLQQSWAEYEGLRVGLLTSASHLPRAMRLARRAGLDDLVPIPAHHTVTQQSYSIAYFLPSAHNLEIMAVVQREWMGQLIGR